MNQFNPVTEEEREEIRRLHGEGRGRNEIATIIGRGLRTVSVHCEKMGLTFDRTATAAATEAKIIDAKARRAALISGLYDIAEDDLAYLKQGGDYRLVEVSSGKAVRYRADRLPAQDRRVLVNAISTAMSAATRLEALDTNNGVDDARSMVGQLMVGLKAVYDGQRAADEEAEGESP